MIVKSLCLVFACLALAAFNGCNPFKGPTGPAGVNGANGTNGANGLNGKDGIDGSTKCEVCHANNQLIVSKEYQWSLSKHSEGTTFNSEGTNSACIACHNGAAFIFSLSHDDSVNVMANPVNINCRTCHKVHTKYDTTDMSLVGDEAPVKAKIDNSIVFDYGAGNLCSNCHQLRTNWMADVMAGTGTEAINPNNTITSTAIMVGIDSIKFTATASRASDHYGAQAQIIAGKGIWLPDNSTPPQSFHRTVVADGCVDCHLGPERNHSYQPQLAGCNTAQCHSAPALKNFDFDSVQTKVLALSKTLRDSLISKGIVTWDSTKVFPDPTGIVFNGKGKTFSKLVVGAFINLQDILWDGSKGVHNAKFVQYLLNTDIANLKK
jgi:hypothetical protein